MDGAAATAEARATRGDAPRRRWPDWAAGYALMAPTLVVMGAMLVTPLGALVLASFWTQTGFAIDTSPTLRNYATILAPSTEPTWWGGMPFFFEKPVYMILLVKSLLMALAATAAAILLAWPMAYFLAFRVRRRKALWMILITIPFWTSYLLRVFSWKIVLGHGGVINSGLIWLGVIEQPLGFLLYNPAAVVVTLAHAWAAFAILPIYVSLEKIDRSLLDAASDLGDTRWRRFLRVTLPLSAPGTIAATLLVFVPTVGDYVTPTLVGGSGGLMIGNAIQNQFGRANDAPLGAALSVVMMAVTTLVACAFVWAARPRRRA